MHTHSKDRSGQTISMQKEDRPLLNRQSILASPRFFLAEREIATKLIDVHKHNPRMARLMASYKKWLLTHAIFAMANQRNPDDSLSGLTPGRLLDLVEQYGAVSRNTASSYVAELVAYKFLQPVEQDTDRRLKVIETTTLAEDGMRTWYDGHLACLDLLDGGGRIECSHQRPELIFKAQPMMIDRILADPEWRNPHPSMLYFLGSDIGGLLLHYIITRLENFPAGIEKLEIGAVSIPAMSDLFGISQSNAKRIFRKCEEQNLLGWTEARRRGNMWVSGTLIGAHLRRQAVKFEFVDLAFHETCRQLDATRQ